MTALADRLRELTRHIDYDDRAEIPRDVHSFLEVLVEEVEALKAAAPRTTVEAPDGMSRADALTTAREHVEAMSTNGRGFQDGVKLADKVQAVDRFARFLMGEGE